MASHCVILVYGFFDAGHHVPYAGVHVLGDQLTVSHVVLPWQHAPPLLEPLPQSGPHGQ